MSQLETVHGTRHVNVSDHDPDVASGRQQLDGLVRVECLKAALICSVYGFGARASTSTNTFTSPVMPKATACHGAFLFHTGGTPGGAWHRLAPERKIRATVKVIGGPVYTAKEIERLHYGPKPT